MARPLLKKVRGIFEKVQGSGVWWVRWADSGGKIHREKAGTRETAGILYRKRKTEVLQGKKLPECLRKNVLTFGDLAEKVREHARDADYSDRYRAILRQEISKLESWWDERAADSLKPSEIEAKLNEHAKTPATFNRYKATLSLAYRLALKDSLLEVNPARIVGHKKENNARLRYLSEAEEAKLRKTIRDYCPSHEPEFDLALYTGMRRSEQYGLLWHNVDFTTGLITIPRSKHGEVRYVRISSLAKSALQALVRFRKGDDSPVCPGGMTRGGYRDRWFFECVEKAGLLDVIWHSLRHTYISRAIMKGLDIRTVKDLAGHKTITMTDRYAHLAPDYLREAAERAVSPVRTDTKTDTGHFQEQPISRGYVQ
ncbi:MAG: site-specific integrase [Terriglobia bacterium]|jgi:integrase